MESYKTWFKVTLIYKVNIKNLLKSNILITFKTTFTDGEWTILYGRLFQTFATRDPK